MQENRKKAVVGIFDTYEENGYYYITLRNGELINE